MSGTPGKSVKRHQERRARPIAHHTPVAALGASRPGRTGDQTRRNKGRMPLLRESQPLQVTHHCEASLSLVHPCWWTMTHRKVVTDSGSQQ